MKKDNFYSSNRIKLIPESEYPKFIDWVNKHDHEVIAGTYINAYLQTKKDKITDWFN